MILIIDLLDIFPWEKEECSNLKTGRNVLKGPV